jgi:hypothetical protein
MRRTLVAAAVAAAAVLLMAQPAGAAVGSPAATATLTPVTVTTDRYISAQFSSNLVKTSTGFTGRFWSVDAHVSSDPGASLLNVNLCLDYFDKAQTFLRQTCRLGQTSQFGHTFDVADLSFGRVSASNIPAQICTNDENGLPVGTCKAAAPISLRVSVVGTGPITYSRYTQSIPGVYLYDQRGRDRGGVASGTFNGKPAPSAYHNGQLSTSTTKQAGTFPCGAATSGVVVPAGC